MIPRSKSFDQLSDYTVGLPVLTDSRDWIVLFALHFYTDFFASSGSSTSQQDRHCVFYDRILILAYRYCTIVLYRGYGTAVVRSYRPYQTDQYLFTTGINRRIFKIIRKFRIPELGNFPECRENGSVFFCSQKGKNFENSTPCAFRIGILSTS